MSPLRNWSPWTVLLCVAMAAPGCRRAAPPSFTPGKAVVELTADLEDPEVIKTYKDLQNQIASIMRTRTGTPEHIIALGEESSTPHLERGYAIFSRYCTQCHGVNGDGNGPVAQYMNPKPRNYKYGIFKFTSTPYGAKPRRADLIRTVRRGVTGTSMPSFDRFSETDLEAVVDYVIALAKRGEFERELAQIAYDDEELPDKEGIDDVVADILAPWQDSASEIVMPISPMPPMTQASIVAGHKLFLKYACNKCHGKYGRGGAMGNVQVGEDAWGNKAAAADLSSGMFRGGGRPIDIYRRIYSGINGTPMPSFKTQFSDEPDAIWELVHFIKATGERRREGKPPLGEADLPTDDQAATNPAEQPATEEEKASQQAPTENKTEQEAADQAA